MTKVLLCSTVGVISDAVNELEREGRLKKVVLAVFGAPRSKDSGSSCLHVDHGALIATGLEGTFEGVDLSYLTIDLLDEIAWSEKYVYPMMDRLDPLKTHTHAQRKYLYHFLLCFWAAIIDRRKFDVAIFGSAPHEVSDFVLYAICKSRNIQTLVFNYTRLPGVCFLSTDYTPRGIEHTGGTQGAEHTKPVKEYLARIRQDYVHAIPIDTKEALDKFGGPKPSGWAAKLDRLTAMPWIAARKVGTALRVLRRLRLEELRALSQHKIVAAEWRALTADYEARTRNFSRPSRYVYFLLNFQPENTTSPLGGRFVDQYLAVSTLAHHLPDDCSIVVKEHPAQFLDFDHYNYLGRDANYYERLSKIRGVCFAPLSSDHFALLDGSLFVASVNGTVGWEAVVRRKPAVVFGEAWYQGAPGVFKVDKDEDCLAAVRRILAGVPISDEMIDDFLARFLTDCEVLCLTPEDARVAGVSFGMGENVATAKRAIGRYLKPS